MPWIFLKGVWSVMSESPEPKKKAYTKPQIEVVRLSLAEVTLGTNCRYANPANDEITCGTGITSPCSRT
jgi:hypothetical protein